MPQLSSMNGFLFECHGGTVVVRLVASARLAFNLRQERWYAATSSASNPLFAPGCRPALRELHEVLAVLVLVFVPTLSCGVLVHVAAVLGQDWYPGQSSPRRCWIPRQARVLGFPTHSHWPEGW